MHPKVTMVGVNLHTEILVLMQVTPIACHIRHTIIRIIHPTLTLITVLGIMDIIRLIMDIILTEVIFRIVDTMEDTKTAEFITLPVALTRIGLC